MVGNANPEDCVLAVNVVVIITKLWRVKHVGINTLQFEMSVHTYLLQLRKQWVLVLLHVER